MKISGSRVATVGLAALLASGAPASAMSWIDCTGQMVTTKAGKSEEPVPMHDIYAIDDAAKTFFRYSAARKSADLEPVTSFDDKQISWAEKADLGALDSNWDGHFDRTSMALKVEYRQIPESTVLTEQCKATEAPPIAEAAAPTPPAAAPAAVKPAAKPPAPAPGKPKG